MNQGIDPGARECIFKPAPVIHFIRDIVIGFMMRFELGLEKPDPKRALVSAATIAGAYIAGGLIPLAPQLHLENQPIESCAR